MIAAAMCGTMPSVHPNAATILARDPRERPAAKVNSTPVPGDAMTIRDVIRNSMLMIAPCRLGRAKEDPTYRFGSRYSYTAIRHDDGAGHVRRGLAGEEGDDAADLVGLADAAQGRRSEARLESLLVLPQGTCEVRLDDAGGDAVDAHVLPSPLDRKAAGELEVRRLGDAVGAQHGAAAQ